MRPQLSFILPCYNVEKYIEKCVESIYVSDLSVEDFEIVCVNDCSPDHTIDILHRLEKRYSNLRVLDLPHHFFWGGARNEGLKAAKGEYVWFVDTDDIICSNGVRKAVGVAVTEQLDVLCFNYRKIDNIGTELSRHIIFGNHQTMSGIPFVQGTLGTGIVHHIGYVWRFLYRRDYLINNNFYFPEGVCWEDTVFMPETMLSADRIASIEDVLYSYRVNADSISGTYVRRYPGKLIFEYAFCAGSDLLNYAIRVDNAELSKVFREFAKTKYINGFYVNLCRTSFAERCAFYKLVQNNGSTLKELYPVMTGFTRWLLYPILGRFHSELLSYIYKFKKSV